MDLPFEAESYTRHLRAAGRSEQTIKTYMKAVTALLEYLKTHPAEPITRKDLEEFLAYELDRGLSKQTVHQHHASLRQFFKYAAAENEEPDPTEGIKPPTPEVRPPTVLTSKQLERLFATCTGATFEQRRDLAILSLFADTGIRRSELADITVADLDQAEQSVIVTGKTGTRGVPFGSVTAERLDRYIRFRRRHPQADLPWLWLGKKGRLTAFGVEDMVARRAAEAGVRVHPHLFRHTFAHMWLNDGGNEGDLQRLAGWKSGAMLQRYGASAASARARRAYLAGRSPVDKLGKG